jgi:hypothetical protein
MSVCDGFAHLFESREGAEAWWEQTLCRMYTTARQLWREEDDAILLLYGGQPSAVGTSRQTPGVVTRLERKLAAGWRPESVSALEGFLWARLRYEYKSLLCLRCGVRQWQLLSDHILGVVGTSEDDGAVVLAHSQMIAQERQARAAELAAVRSALEASTGLCQLLDAIAEEVAASEEADEDATAEGWRKRVLQRVGSRLNLSQAALHQRLKRIRDTWQEVAGR